ncbi:nephrocystin-1 isoform X2 [Dunckerocampus dactyliophorus]|uniref:nephrocystin-1 isoform X2 n=1 Tax=Dunckerocampus dactyliophorus TaxID=161453 RepID=UPI002405FD74|nr:nephrocystin-1 isoform X2 [Dunckerocampus dactyliophorus]
MPLPKRTGPLQQVHREVDDIRRKLDSLLKDVQSKAESKEEAFRRCQELQTSAEKTLNDLTKLTKADELAPVGNYDQRKLEEEGRLQNILEQMNKLSLELSPPGPSFEPPRGDKLKDKNSEKSLEDSDDDNSDEDVDNKCCGDESQAPKPSSLSEPCIYMALSDFKGDQEGDLSVQKGERLNIIRKTSDGWWLAEDSKGNRGVVPRTYLKIGSNISDKDKDEEEEEEESEEDEEEGDSEELDDEEKHSDATHSNWSTFRKALTEIDATDVLSAMGAIPSGFRPSTLNKLLVEEDAKYKGSFQMQPQLSQSQLSFNDLFLEPDTGRVRSRHVKTCVCFTLWSCKRIPTPGVGVQVLSRHIRLCAYDGTQVLSNIHTVRVSYNTKSPKTWTFSPRTVGVLPTLLNGDCFLRCNSDSPDLGILFELGVTFIRNSTGERGDLSCGWAFLKLIDAAGNQIPNRTYELPVSGGTPYEKDVRVEASLTKGSPAGVFQQMLQARRQPTLIIKLQSPGSRTKASLSLLPDTLLYCLSCVHLLALYRQILADALLVDRATMQNADLICSPVLSTFPTLVDQPDLLDAVRMAWMNAESNMSRGQKRDEAYLKQEFFKVYMASAYSLLNSPTLPAYRWADPVSEEWRSRVISSTLEELKNASGQSGSQEAFAESAAHQQLAFDVAEMTFDLLQATR